MTLNELFRRTGEPTYHTPIAVIGELVNQSGGQVTIINPLSFQAACMAQRLGEEVQVWKAVLLHL